jgi:hypothetical protein
MRKFTQQFLFANLFFLYCTQKIFNMKEYLMNSSYKYLCNQYTSIKNEACGGCSSFASITRECQFLPAICSNLNSWCCGNLLNENHEITQDISLAVMCVPTKEDQRGCSNNSVFNQTQLTTKFCPAATFCNSKHLLVNIDSIYDGKNENICLSICEKPSNINEPLELSKLVNCEACNSYIGFESNEICGLNQKCNGQYIEFLNFTQNNVITSFFLNTQNIIMNTNTSNANYYLVEVMNAYEKYNQKSFQKILYTSNFYQDYDLQIKNNVIGCVSTLCQKTELCNGCDSTTSLFLKDFNNNNSYISFINVCGGITDACLGNLTELYYPDGSIYVVCYLFNEYNSNSCYNGLREFGSEIGSKTGSLLTNLRPDICGISLPMCYGVVNNNNCENSCIECEGCVSLNDYHWVSTEYKHESIGICPPSMFCMNIHNNSCPALIKTQKIQDIRTNGCVLKPYSTINSCYMKNELCSQDYLCCNDRENLLYQNYCSLNDFNISFVSFSSNITNITNDLTEIPFAYLQGYCRLEKPSISCFALPEICSGETLCCGKVYDVDEIVTPNGNISFSGFMKFCGNPDIEYKSTIKMLIASVVIGGIIFLASCSLCTHLVVEDIWEFILH